MKQIIHYSGWPPLQDGQALVQQNLVFKVEASLSEVVVPPTVMLPQHTEMQPTSLHTIACGP